MSSAVTMPGLAPLTGSVGTAGVYLDPEQLRQVTALLANVPSGIEKALNRAINKVAIHARVEVVRMITDRLNLKQSDVRDRNVKLRKASYSNLVAVLAITGRRVPLKDFGASFRQKSGGGVSYAIQRGGARVTIPDAFEATMPSGHVGIFKRKPGKGKASRSQTLRAQYPGSLPISKLYGPSVPAALKGIEEFAGGRFAFAMQTRLADEVTTQAALVLAGHAKEENLVPI